MEFVMRYLFWIVLLVIVALAGGFWFLTVPGQQAESKKLQQDINTAATELQIYAAKRDKIKTKAHVEAAESYKAKLTAEDQAVKALFRGKKTILAPKFEKAPTDPLRFDEWLIGVRKEILDQATKVGLVLPTNFAQAWLDEGRITTKADREPRMRKISMAGEVVRLLCSVKAPVPVTEFASKPDQPETKKDVALGVASLDGLELLDPAKRDARVKDYMTKAFASSAKPPAALKALPKRPCRTSLLDVRFSAPLQVVPAVVQAFETGPLWFGKVIKIDCQRAAEPYSKTPIPATAETVQVDNMGKPKFLNTHYREAPVQVQIWVELMDFDEKALK